MGWALQMNPLVVPVLYRKPRHTTQAMQGCAHQAQHGGVEKASFSSCTDSVAGSALWFIAYQAAPIA